MAWKPWHFIAVAIAGWMNRQSQAKDHIGNLCWDYDPASDLQAGDPAYIASTD